MADLVTLPQAKQHLNISASANDAELSTFITRASAVIEKKARRNWSGATFVEKHDGGTADLVLFNSPVASVTSIDDNGSAVASGDYVLYQETGLIHLTSGAFAGGKGKVVVTYVTTSTVPANITQATLELVRHLWQTQRGSMGARNPLSGDDYAVGMSFTLPRRVIELMEEDTFHGGIG